LIVIVGVRAHGSLTLLLMNPQLRRVFPLGANLGEATFQLAAAEAFGAAADLPVDRQSAARLAIMRRTARDRSRRPRAIPASTSAGL
jgi:hypothetical protein